MGSFSFILNYFMKGVNMGFFSKFFKNDDKGGKTIEIFSPIDGELIELSKVPDEAFACGALGDGVALIPSNSGSNIIAPCDAEEISIFTTNHAVSFETKDELELIVHFGVDTVKLDGNGFKRLAEEGMVKKGDKLVEYDLEFLEKNAKSTITPVIISNMEMVDSIEKKSGIVKAGDLIMTVNLK